MVGNFIVFSKHHIGEPIFFHHNYQLETGELTIVDLYFVRDKADNRIINAVSMPEIDGQMHTAYEHLYQTSTYYNVKQLTLELNSNEWEDFKEPNTIPAILLHFNDGSFAHPKIGDVTFFTTDVAPMEMNSSYSGSSTASGGRFGFTPAMDFTLTSVEFPENGELDEQLKVKMTVGTESFDIKNGKTSFEQDPLLIRSGTTTAIEWDFHLTDDDPLQLNAYQNRVILHGINADGQPVAEPIHISHIPILFDKSLNAFIQERKGL